MQGISEMAEQHLACQEGFHSVESIYFVFVVYIAIIIIIVCVFVYCRIQVLIYEPALIC
jgi:hypothetical protein